MAKAIFKWDSLREIGPLDLPYLEPVKGFHLEVDLVQGPRIDVFRSCDGRFYFCHGLTFGGKEAPGGAVSPFSGRDVRAILENKYDLVVPISGARSGDILVWKAPDENTPHSAILVVPVLTKNGEDLSYDSLLLSKNGKLPEEVVTLGNLADGRDSYGESYSLYRQKD